MKNIIKVNEFDPHLSSEAGLISDYKFMEKSSLFHLNITDFARGAVTAVFTAVVVALGGIVGQAGFNLFVADWHAIFNMMFQAAVAAFIGYLGKNWISDENGKVLGKI